MIGRSDSFRQGFPGRSWVIGRSDYKWFGMAWLGAGFGCWWGGGFGAGWGGRGRKQFATPQPPPPETTNQNFFCCSSRRAAGYIIIVITIVDIQVSQQHSFTTE